MTTVNRITSEGIASRISRVNYTRIEDTTLTICTIKMVNGFVVTGESACADWLNFDEQIGKNISYANAFQKLWALEGYLLKERMHQGEQA